MKDKFINTEDEETANLLRELGYSELPKNGNKWVFINQPGKMEFASDDMDIFYTNVLTF